MNEEEVKNKLKENNLNWNDFMKWMQGQTISTDKEGNAKFFTYDVNRFISQSN
ncbi:hypothetical protein [Marivirga sp.]|uniref:hypothetical protein n=1 Tax=Marivirga sp. TaxID=2018662 RepID=UPI003DA6D6E7